MLFLEIVNSKAVCFGFTYAWWIQNLGYACMGIFLENHCWAENCIVRVTKQQIVPHIYTALRKKRVPK